MRYFLMQNEILLIKTPRNGANKFGFFINERTIE